MSAKDQTNKVKLVILQEGNLTADTWSKYVDLQDFESCTFLVYSDMTTADASNYVTPVVKEASATPASTASYTSVASADLIGSFSARNATTTTLDPSSEQVGYIGDNRYVAVLLDETGTADGDFVVVACLGYATDEPCPSVTSGAIS